MLLELKDHAQSSFVTLTYDDDHNPEELRPDDLSQFIRSMRRSGHKFRYFAAGEYGSKTYRPHYHIFGFGLPSCRHGQTVFGKDGSPRCCPVCQNVYQHWGKGRIETALPRNHKQVAGYVASYVVKSVSDKKDENLEGMQPEFARMSLKPAIGLSFIDDLASQLMLSGYDEIDVPTHVVIDGKRQFLGRYLRRELRKRMGRPPETPKEVLDGLTEEMQPLWEAAEAHAAPNHKALYVQTRLYAEGVQKRRNQAARDRRNAKDPVL